MAIVHSLNFSCTPGRTRAPEFADKSTPGIRTNEHVRSRTTCIRTLLQTQAQFVRAARKQAILNDSRAAQLDRPPPLLALVVVPGEHEPPDVQRLLQHPWTPFGTPGSPVSINYTAVERCTWVPRPDQLDRALLHVRK